MALEGDLICFENPDVMAKRLADVIEAHLARRIAERGWANLAVSGGSTPAGLYAALSKRRLDWPRVTAVLVDDRWTAPGTQGSNETFVRELLVQNQAASLNLIGLWSHATSPAQGLKTAVTRLATIKGPFDAVVLGMGLDGHTASWFPYATGLKRALDEADSKVAAITARQSAVTGLCVDRMTLTLSVIADAHFICLMITGEEKRKIFEQALEGGSIEAMPVRAILNARPDIWAAWAP